MIGNKNNEAEKNSFAERYRQVSDDKLMDILKNRLNYQKEAADCAIEEAKNRGLIKSEHDLEQPQPKIKFKLFPGSTDGNTSGFWSSILRILYIIGSFPIVFGILALAENNITTALVGILSGAIWLGSTYMLKKQRRAIWAYLQTLIALLVSVGGMIYFDFLNHSHSLMDYFVVMIILSLAFITPIYAARICRMTK